MKEKYQKMQRKKKIDRENGFGEWGGYMDAKITKLEEQFVSDAAKNPYLKSNLFAGISIFVNGLTNPSADELKRIMMANGGIYHTYKRSTTSFIIASNLPDVKIRQGSRCHIIQPNWIVDCLKENRIVDYSPYLLLTERKTNQPKIEFRGNNDSTATLLDGTKCDIVNNNDDKVQNENTVNDTEDQFSILNQKLCETTIFNNLMSFDTVVPEKPSTSHQMFTDDSKQYAKTATDPNFLAEFYKNSRLHHIATLGANFKYLISELRATHPGSFPERQQLIDIYRINHPENHCDSIDSTCAIMHIDMDCFFVSVGLRNRSHLRGKPIAVTHSRGSNAGPMSVTNLESRQKEIELYAKRLNDKTGDTQRSESKFGANISSTDSLSEIASCSYEARLLGIKNGMMVGSALKLCPNLVTIPYDFDEYKEVAETLYSVMAKYTLNIEAVSCDEMYVDLSDLCENTCIPVMEFVTMVRNEIQEKTNCPCSAGIGANRLQARMATKKAKPNGQFQLTPDNVQKYFSNIKIADLPGVGPSTEYKLRQNNWITCEDLQSVSLTKLQMEFGKKFAERLHEYCRGIDSKPLVFGQVRKSVSVEVNYGIRFTTNDELEFFLKQLCHEVHSRLTEIKRRGKTITLKLMIRSKDAPIETAKYMGHGVCDYFTKSQSLSDYTCSLDTIIKTVINIKNGVNISPDQLRGIGIHIGRLDVDTNTTVVIEDIKSRNSLKAMFNKVKERNLQKSINNDTTVTANTSKETSMNTIADTTMPKKVQRKKASTSTASNYKSKLRIRKSKQTGSTRDVSTMLANIKPKSNNHSSILYDNIDMNTLMELPENIRNEIMGNYKPSHKKSPTKLPAKKETEEKSIDPEFLAALPDDIRNELLAENKQMTSTKKEKRTSSSPTKQNVISYNINTSSKQQLIERSPDKIPLNAMQIISPENVLVSENWRPLLKEWIESTDEPLDFDIKLISSYGIELVVAPKLNELYIVCRYLFRIIEERKSCNWHLVYYHILASIQKEMVCTHGYLLFVKKDFPCDNCDSKSIENIYK